MPNILSTVPVRTETTRNSHRFSLVFSGLEAVLDRAKNSNLELVRQKYEGLKSAFLKTGYTVEQTLEVSLHSVTIPNIELEFEDIHRFNDSFKALTKFAPVTEMQVMFYDYVNGSATAILEAWRALCGDKRSGALGFKEDYALSEANFYLYGPQAPAQDDLNSAWLERWVIINLYPKSVDTGEHSFEGGGVRKVTSQFLFDNIYLIESKGRPPLRAT